MAPIFSVAPPTASILGGAQRFSIRRLFCGGENYADHVREMGSDPSREPPFFFSKPADAVAPGPADIVMPPAGVMINDTTDHRFVAMPFGGAGRGHIGRQGVRFAVREMSQTKVSVFP